MLERPLVLRFCRIDAEIYHGETSRNRLLNHMRISLIPGSTYYMRLIINGLVIVAILGTLSIRSTAQSRLQTTDYRLCNALYRAKTIILVRAARMPVPSPTETLQALG